LVAWTPVLVVRAPVLVAWTPVWAVGTLVFVACTPVLVDVVAGALPTAAGVPGTAVAAPPFVDPLLVIASVFVVPVEGAEALFVAGLPAAERGAPEGPFVPGLALVFPGVGVAVGLLAAAGWPAGVELLAPVFCAVAIVAMAAASARI
jgi:hypothetical protein